MLLGSSLKLRRLFKACNALGLWLVPVGLHEVCVHGKEAGWLHRLFKVCGVSGCSVLRCDVEEVEHLQQVTGPQGCSVPELA